MNSVIYLDCQSWKHWFGYVGLIDLWQPYRAPVLHQGPLSFSHQQAANSPGSTTSLILFLHPLRHGKPWTDKWTGPHLSEKHPHHPPSPGFTQSKLPKPCCAGKARAPAAAEATKPPTLGVLLHQGFALREQETVAQAGCTTMVKVPFLPGQEAVPRSYPHPAEVLGTLHITRRKSSRWGPLLPCCKICPVTIQSGWVQASMNKKR